MNNNNISWYTGMNNNNNNNIHSGIICGSPHAMQISWQGVQGI